MTHENQFDGISEEVKAKLRGCETPEEILELAREEGYELSEEELEGVSGGGWVCSDYTHTCRPDEWPSCRQAE